MKLEYKANGRQVYDNVPQDWDQSKALADEIEKLKQLLVEESELGEANSEPGDNSSFPLNMKV